MASDDAVRVGIHGGRPIRTGRGPGSIDQAGTGEDERCGRWCLRQRKPQRKHYRYHQRAYCEQHRAYRNMTHLAAAQAMPSGRERVGKEIRPVSSSVLRSIIATLSSPSAATYARDPSGTTWMPVTGELPILIRLITARWPGLRHSRGRRAKAPTESKFLLNSSGTSLLRHGLGASYHRFPRDQESLKNSPFSTTRGAERVSAVRRPRSEPMTLYRLGC